MDSATDSSTDSDYQEQQENELLTFEQFLGINSPLKSNQRNVTENVLYFLRSYYVKSWAWRMITHVHCTHLRVIIFWESELGLKGRDM